MTYIRDLVTLDKQAEFRNDVQMSHYDDPKTNLGLLQSFIFSYNAPQGKKSAIDLLETLKNVFTIGRQENRMVCIANYGHGKSHLALVIANYFAKPYGSPELEKVLEKIGKSVENSTKLDRLRDFRKEQGEFLVVRLRGDVNIGLREQFIKQVQTALKEHNSTANKPLSFWSDKALQLLDGLTETQQSVAEQFLSGKETDLAGLKNDVRNHRDQGYDRTRQLIKHITGVLPDLGGEVSLQKLIKEISSEYCGENNPLAGIVVLFDEFSLFVQRYAQRRSAGELQELLVGVEELGDKAVFLAFSQHDPITVAKTYAASQEQSQSLEHELTRIPRKEFLYSLLESVIDAYLDQPTRAWENFVTNPDVRGPIVRASNAAMAIFYKRYENELRWDPEKFDQIVTRGAFPLHPLTTALLCNLSFSGSETIGNPRTLLGFIREQVALMQDQPVIQNHQINWILPIFLVDYFKEYLGKEPFKRFEVAVNKLPVNAPDEHTRLLKALLLQNVAELKLTRDDQEIFLQEAAGIPYNSIKKNLSELVSIQAIRLDNINRTYSFWSLSTDPDALKKKIQKKIEGKELDWDTLEILSKSQVKAIPIEVKWGHAEDWEAKEVILTAKFFTVDRISKLFPRYHMSVSGNLEEGVRGGVVWVLPETNEDAEWIQKNAENIIDQAFPGDFPLPIVVKTTHRVFPDLIKAFHTLNALEAMNEPERKETGLELFEIERLQQQTIIRNEMITLRGEETNFSSIPHKLKNYFMPAAYRSLVRLSQTPSIKQVLEECYRLAYPFHPPEFYSTYKNSANNLRKATRLLATLLMNNSISTNQLSLRADKIAQDILQKFLYAKWKIMSVDNRIKESDNGNIVKAWTIFEETYKPGIRGVYLRETLVKLLNTPFGYDNNTLKLLLSAWIGYHQHDLQFTSISQQIGIEGLTSILNEITGHKTFIGEICGPHKVSVSRRDAGELVREVTSLIELVNRGTLTQSEADETINKLKIHCADAGLPEEICTAANNAIDRLTTSLELAQKYDNDAKAIYDELENGHDLQNFIQQQKRIQQLPRTELVKPSEKSIAELEAIWHDSLQKKVETECTEMVKVTRLQDVGLNQSRLENTKKLLLKAKLDNQVQQVEEALTQISLRENELETQENELPVQNEIRAMSRQMPLQTLRTFVKRLQEIKGFSQITMDLRDQSLNEIKAEILQLEQISNGLTASIVNIDSKKTANEWQTTYLRNISRFEGSPLQSELDKIHETVNQIQGFLDELQEIEQYPITNFESAAEAMNKFEILKIKAQPWLRGKALQKIIDSQLQLKTQVQEKTSEAHQWLEKVQELCATNEPLYKIIQALGVKQPFLLPDDQEKLIQLKQNVKHKQEEDVVARIENDFRQIADPKLRQECLQRLQAILAETHESSSAK